MASAQGGLHEGWDVLSGQAMLPGILPQVSLVYKSLARWKGISVKQESTCERQCSTSKGGRKYYLIPLIYLFESLPQPQVPGFGGHIAAVSVVFAENLARISKHAASDSTRVH